MPQAYVPIQTVKLTSNASSIEFTNIPQNYTDLMLYVSSRSSRNAGVGTSIYLKFNSSASGYTYRYLYGQTTSAYSENQATTNNLTTRGFAGFTSNTNNTESTFGNTKIYIPNYAGSTNKTYSSDFVQENNSSTDNLLGMVAGLWSNTAAITSIEVTVYQAADFNILANSTVTLYGVGGARASGGTITADDTYTYHTFTSSGTFLPLERIKGAEVLVIAGGGSGGGAKGGGGGAGELRNIPGQQLTAGTSYTVTVGAGAAASTNTTQGNDGSNSSFFSISATGGGGGGEGATGSGATSDGRSGGSGGGGSGVGFVADPGLGNAGGYNPVEGYNGGDGPSSTNRGAGGGGAGGVGADGGDGFGGVGSSQFTAWGYATSTGQLFSSTYYFAGGGGGGDSQGTGGGTGGLGGGGKGGDRNTNNAVAGTANTGGGGGGGADGSTTSYVGGAGGSGLVIVRYPN